MTEEGSTPPSIGYLIIRAVCLVLGKILFDVRVEDGANRPLPGSILAAVPHRNWVEPLLLLAYLPARPRLAILADRRTVERSRLRRWLVGATGTAVPTSGGGGDGLASTVRSSAEIVAHGAVLAIFPESGPPSQVPQLRRLSAGVALISAYAGAPVVPVVFGGTHEVYFRRRIVIRALPSLSPPQDSSQPTISRFMDTLRATSEAAAAEVHRQAELDGPRWKVGRWLTGRYPRL